MAVTLTPASVFSLIRIVLLAPSDNTGQRRPDVPGNPAIRNPLRESRFQEHHAQLLGDADGTGRSIEVADRMPRSGWRRRNAAAVGLSSRPSRSDIAWTEREPAVDHVAQVALADLDRVVIRALQDLEGRVGNLVVAGLAATDVGPVRVAVRDGRRAGRADVWRTSSTGCTVPGCQDRAGSARPSYTWEYHDRLLPGCPRQELLRDDRWDGSVVGRELVRLARVVASSPNSPDGGKTFLC